MPLHFTTNGHAPCSKMRVVRAALYSDLYTLLRAFRATNKTELDGMREDFISWLDAYSMPVYGFADAVDKWRAYHDFTSDGGRVIDIAN